MSKYLKIISLIALLTLLPIRAQGQDAFSRDIESVKFIPKGQWITGISINYTQSSQDKYQFFILEGISGDTYSFKVTPMVAYAFKDDMAAGAKFGYDRSLTKLENAKVVLDANTGYEIQDIYSLSHSYYAMAIFRNYFSLGRSKRFGFFNECQVQLGGGQSKLTKGRGADVIGGYMQNFSLNVGLAPGLIVFLNNYSAVEVNIGVLGFSYRHSKQTNNQVSIGDFKTHAANFRINLFSISFGCAFYL